MAKVADSDVGQEEVRGPSTAGPGPPTRGWEDASGASTDAPASRSILIACLLAKPTAHVSSVWPRAESLSWMSSGVKDEMDLLSITTSPRAIEDHTACWSDMPAKKKRRSARAALFLRLAKFFFDTKLEDRQLRQNEY